jgi:tetratricopeptide (TPR) repeat protein
LLAEGEFALVRQQLEMALDQKSTWVGDNDLYAMLVEAAVGRQDVEALEKYLPLLDEAANRYDHLLYQAIAQRGWGVAHRLSGEHKEAAARLDHALQLFQKLGTHWQSARTLVELGELANNRSDTDRAHDYSSQALAIFSEMGAKPDEVRVQTKLSSLK